jgi:hypothetical protein
VDAPDDAAEQRVHARRGPTQYLRSATERDDLSYTICAWNPRMSSASLVAPDSPQRG